MKELDVKEGLDSRIDRCAQEIIGGEGCQQRLDKLQARGKRAERPVPRHSGSHWIAS